MIQLEEVRSSIDRACHDCGRDPSSASLRAVSKTHPYELVLEAYDQGQRLFGENRVQEVEAKFPPLAGRPDGMHLSLIGHLQRNKVRKAVQLFNRIDSVDSIPLMDALEKELAREDRVMEVLFELNSSHEEAKTGFPDDDSFFDAVGHLSSCPHLKLRGLMTVGPLGGDEEAVRSAFAHVKELYDKLNADGWKLDVLSMGMSGDYPIALSQGATELRIGSAIFGARDYSK